MSEGKKPFKEIRPAFIETRNVGRARTLMRALALTPGKPRFGAIYGRAGAGKTFWATAHVATQAEVSPYLKCQWVWAQSELEFVRALARAGGVKDPPYRKVGCFQAILDFMTARPHLPLFVDDFHRFERSPGHLEILRDLTEFSGAPIVLIGEEPLEGMLQAHRQVWSRTYQALEFGPNQPADIVILAREAAGLDLSLEAAAELHQWAGGDFRPLDSALAACLQKARSKAADQTAVTLEDVKAVLKTLLAPRGRGRKQ